MSGELKNEIKRVIFILVAAAIFATIAVSRAGSWNKTTLMVIPGILGACTALLSYFIWPVNKGNNS